MATVAPSGTVKLWHYIDELIPASKLGGIVGDTQHYGGYHCSREDNKRRWPGNYSYTQDKHDLKGPANAASALDITLPPHLMKLLTKRLVKAAKAGDPRMEVLREFCGTLNGKDTCPWTVNPRLSFQGFNTWDPTHLWHIHLSELRQFCNDFAALKGVGDVLAGIRLNKVKHPKPTAAPKPAPKPSKTQGGKLVRKWLLPLGHAYGLINSKNKRLHGGTNAADKAAIKWIQMCWVSLGYVSGVREGTAQARAWCDGVFGPESVAVCKRFYQRNYKKEQGHVGRGAYLLLVANKAK